MPSTSLIGHVYPMTSVSDALGSVVAVARWRMPGSGCRTSSSFRPAPSRSAIRPGFAPSEHAELPQAIKEAGFTARAFGVTTAWADRAARNREIAKVRWREFAAHADDEVTTTPSASA